MQPSLTTGIRSKECCNGQSRSRPAARTCNVRSGFAGMFWRLIGFRVWGLGFSMGSEECGGLGREVFRELHVSNDATVQDNLQDPCVQSARDKLIRRWYKRKPGLVLADYQSLAGAAQVYGLRTCNLMPRPLTYCDVATP